MIFGPNESSRRNLFFENFSNGRNERKYFNSEKNFRKKFEKYLIINKIISGGALGFRRGWRGITWLGPVSWPCLAWPCLGWPRLGWPWPGLAPAGVGLSRIGLARLGLGLAWPLPGLAPTSWAPLALALPWLGPGLA